MSPAIVHNDDRALLLDVLRGQTIPIPDFVSLLYADWVIEKHKDEPRLRREILEELDPRLVIYMSWEECHTH